MPQVKPIDNYIDKPLEDGRVLPLDPSEENTESDQGGIPEVIKVFLSSRNRILDYGFTQKNFQKKKNLVLMFHKK